jgi:hypothetical protein
MEVERKGELDGSLPKMKFIHAPSTRWLAGFAMGVSLTIAVHFYDFFALAFFIMAGGVCYALRLVRPRVLWRVFAGGVAGTLAAALPMVIAFALGTPLQGSIGWGLSQMGGGDSASTQSVEAPAASDTTSSSINTTSTSQSVKQTDASTSPQEQQAPKKSMTEKFADLMKDTFRVFSTRITHVWGTPGKRYGASLSYWYLYAALGIIALAVVLRILKQRDYGAQVATMGIALIVMGISLASTGLPWPTLMDIGRTTAFMIYLVPACIAVGMDAVIVLVTLWAKQRVVCDIASGVALALVSYLAFSSFGLQAPSMVSSFEPNGNIICVERILREYPNFNWTIVSANDELRMTEEYGYHVEINQFLNNMEHRFIWHTNDGTHLYKILPAKGAIIIPTEYIFFFIENIPTKANLILYDNSSARGFEETVEYGTPISEEWANKPLPGRPSIDSYRGQSRFIEMSRMYFWAQEYMKRFPNEMEVFYEDDEMVCYRLHQPRADWTDLYIEYGYNGATARMMVEELKHGFDKPYAVGKDGLKHSYPFTSVSNSDLGIYIYEEKKLSDADSIEEGVVNASNQNVTAGAGGGKR